MRAQIRQEAPTAEVNRPLSDEMIAALTKTGMYQAVVPTEYGGYAVGAPAEA